MTSITEQKADLRSILTTHVVDCYEQFDENQQLALVKSLANRLASTMTLQELKAWHNRLSISDYIRAKTLDTRPHP